jgi:hypothetical protein
MVDVMASARVEQHDIGPALELADDVFEVADITFVEAAET